MPSLKTLFVVGTFNDSGGKRSGYALSMVESLFDMGMLSDVTMVNGGTYEILQSTVEKIKDFDVVIWFADIPNDKPKLLNDIKKINPHCFLVSSKNNTNNKYLFIDLVARALESHSNLVVEFKKIKKTLISGTVFDP